MTAQRCADLLSMGWADPQDAAQPETDFFVAYAAAKARAEGFRGQVEAFGAQLGGRPEGVAATVRPGEVKRLERVVEKYTTSLALPLDLLGAKVVVDSLDKLYEVADSVNAQFDVVAYKDRVLAPQKSGYRDVQFIVSVPGLGHPHYAELKIMHTLYDQLDVYEHRLYEIRRGLEARSKDQLRELQTGEKIILTTVEQIVLEEFDQTSRTLFRRIWEEIQNPPS